MIPKIIHLCWLSKEQYPTDIQICLDSWKKNFQIMKYGYGILNGLI